jgi:hypothetical protein
MSKKAKVKTTLDKKHKDKVSIFENKDKSIIDLESKIEANNKILKELEDIPYKDYTNEIIYKKAELLDDNKDLNKSLEMIRSGLDEMLYYNNTMDYVLPYYEQNSRQGDVTHMEIVDFFNGSNIVRKNQSSNNKAQLLENYLKATDNKQVKVGKFKKFKPKFCSNTECKSEMTLHLSDGYLICTECGFCEEVILDSDKPNYKEPVPDATAYSYKRINHFNELTSWSSTSIPILVC